jgi:hypothetical protein
MADGKRTPHVVRKERPAKPTLPISAPKLAELVEDLRTPEPAPAEFELPPPDPEVEDVVELIVDEDQPTQKPSRFAHVVRRPKPP